MKIRRQKKGFTIVELVIVIAVIAVLSAILIPTFAGLIKKAKVAADTALVKNVNTALAMTEANGKNNTVSDALADANEHGYSVDKLTPTQKGYHFVYDMSTNRFALIDDKNDVVYSDGKLTTNTTDLWYILPSTEGLREGYSVYLTAEQETVTLTKLVGIEGKVGTLTVNDASSESTVVIAGEYETVTVNAPKATVNFYGDATTVNVDATANNSFHIFGNVNLVNVNATSGKVVVEASATVNVVYVSKSGATVNVSTSATVAQIAKATGVNVTVPGYEIPETTLDNAIATATEFAGGVGTQAKPFLIANAEQMQNITKYYDSETAHYFKVKDGVTTIDCSENGEWTRVDLNGSFNGNGVTFTNLTNSLFKNVNNVDGLCEIGNFTTGNNTKIVTNSNGTSIIRALETDTKLYNITVHGYIQGNGHTGSFFAYSWDGDITITIENCTSDANIVTANAEPAAAYCGFPMNYPTIYLNNTTFTGNIYSMDAGDAYVYTAQPGHGIWYVDGVEYDNKTNPAKYDADKSFLINKINPVQTETGYTFEKQTSGATAVKAVVSVVVRGQDETGNGYPFNVFTEEIDLTDKTGSVTINYGLIKEIYLNEPGVTETTFVDGVLSIYNPNYAMGYGLPSIQVQQYDANGGLIATGTLSLTTGGNKVVDVYINGTDSKENRPNVYPYPVTNHDYTWTVEDATSLTDVVVYVGKVAETNIISSEYVVVSGNTITVKGEALTDKIYIYYTVA